MFENQTHLDVLLSRIASHGPEPFFKAVRKDAPGGLAWDITTYAQLGRDIDLLSAKLKSVLQGDRVPDGAIVGVWLHGISYIDIVYLFALSMGGYIPNLLSTGLTDPTTILSLFRKTGAEAIIHEPSLDLGADCKICTYTPASINARGTHSLEAIMLTTQEYDPERVAFIQYTSGSTNDTPTPIPCTNKWFKSVYDSWESDWNPAEHGAPQDVFNIPGSFVNPSGLHALLMGINFGAAFAQTTQTPFFSSDELLQLTSQCGLNRLQTFALFLQPHFLAAQKRLENNDDTLLKALQNMRSIVYGGMPMPPFFEDWAFENKLPIMNALGSTETGPLLRSDLGDHPRRLRPFKGLFLEFIPEAAYSDADGGQFKLAVLGGSPNIPHASLLDADGKYYSGDLFSDAKDGTWMHRGRDGDRIKISAGKLVDTKAIEEYIRQHCSDIVAEPLVAGSGRPSLALLAEPVNPNSGQAAKEIVVERMAFFFKSRYEYERLSADKIVFVGRGSLPRTAAKGNVRRKAAELKFKKELDAVYTDHPFFRT